MPNIDILPLEDANENSLILTETDTPAKKGYFRKSSIASLITYIQNLFVKKTDFTSNASIQKRANSGSAIENQTIVNMLKEYLFINGISKIAITNSGGNISQRDISSFENVINIKAINGFDLRYNAGIIYINKGSCRSENNEKDIVLENEINITPAPLEKDETYYLFIDNELDLSFSTNSTPVDPSGQRLIGAFKTSFSAQVYLSGSLVEHDNLHNYGVYGVNLPDNYIENFDIKEVSLTNINMNPGKVFAVGADTSLNNILTHGLTKDFDHAWTYGNSGLRDDVLKLNEQYYLYSISIAGRKNDVICSVQGLTPIFPIDYDTSKMIGIFKSHATLNEIKKDSFFKTPNINAIGSVAKFLDIQPTGTSGGNTISWNWIKRTLNTERNNQIPICKLINDVITLPAGSYQCCVHSSLAGVDIKFRLYDTINNISLLSSQINDFGINEGSMISFSGYFALLGETDIELQYYAKNNVTNGLGIAWDKAPEDEVYSIINFIKVR